MSDLPEKRVETYSIRGWLCMFERTAEKAVLYARNVFARVDAQIL